MGMPEDLEKIRAQEAALVFSEFTEDTAFAIGSALRARAAAEKFPIGIEIRFWDRPLFYAALPGSTGVSPEWLRRKAATVQRWSKSSYRVLLEEKGERLLGAHWALDPTQYALSGGGFPIHARGFGVIGAVAVSGLTERQDHAIVVDAFCDHFGLDRAMYALQEQ
jgi:uncharacterized protein (UPF0303 family)